MSEKCAFGFRACRWDCPKCGTRDVAYVGAEQIDGASLDGNDIKYYINYCPKCKLEYRLVAMEVFIGVQIKGEDYESQS